MINFMRNRARSLTAFTSFSIAVSAVVAIVVFTPVPCDALPSFFDPVEERTLVRSIITAMTPEELLGQVFFLGYQGSRPSSQIENWIRNRSLGGVKIFTRNVASLTSLASDIRRMQEMAMANRFHIPLLVATDQEGGWVRHVRSGSSVTPGNMALGAGGNPGDAYKTGYYLGMELRHLGINMNFAPTVDVYSNPSAIVIGPRAFSSDARFTGLMALAYFQGMQKAGVISTAKHFPGHGDTDKDSHGYLPEVQVSFETLWERDLLPYRFLIKEGLPAVMSGHIAFPKVLKNRLPATVSSFFLRDVLRDRLDFQGVVVTDDLEMDGVHLHQRAFDVPSVSIQALEAGNDMVLLSHTPALQERAWYRMMERLRGDRTFRLRVEEAVGRILRLKLQYLKSGFPILPDVEVVRKRVPLEEAGEFFFDSSCRAVTLLRGEDIPYRGEADERILLIGQKEEFFREGQRRFPGAERYKFPYQPLEWSRNLDRQRVPQLVKGYDTVIFCLTNQNSLEVLRELKGFKGKLFVISALTPVYLSQVPWVESAIAVYSLSGDSFRAGFGALVGDFEAEGRLPLDETMGIKGRSPSQ
jgi:beta-N-acetylhexosaminidase